MNCEDLLKLARADAPLEEQRAAIRQVLSERGVSDEGIEKAMPFARDGVALFEDKDAGGRTSRLGGDALLPEGEEWPSAPEDHPLGFIALIDLGELPDLDPLPKDGTLLVFWDHMYFELSEMDFVAATRVFYVPAGGSTTPATAPDDEHAFGPIPLSGHLMPILGELDNVEVPDEDEDAFYEASDEVTRVYEHSLLGSSRDVQGPVLEEIDYWFGEHVFPETRERFTEEERKGEGWVFLAQIEEAEGLVFGDAGALYLLIPEADLRERRFDRVMGIMQSG